MAYTLQLMVHNNSSSLAQISSNLSSVNIPAGATQHVTLNFTGNGTSFVQLLLDVVSSTSDPLDVTLWNPYIARVSNGLNLLSPNQLILAGWTTGPGASAAVANDASLIPQAYRIQTSGGTTQYKYYATTEISQVGVPYTVQVTVRNNGTHTAQVSSNFGSVNIPAGSSQNVVLNLTGNGTSAVQLLFDTVDSTSDPLDLTVWNPYVARVSDGINLLSSSQLIFAGWSTGPGASANVTNDSSLIP